MKLPWAKFYHADWRSDAALAMCSPSTRGVWIELLCLMWQNNTDRVSGTIDQLSRLCRCTPAEVEAATKEIRSADVAETVNGGSVYTIISRRRARELEVSRVKSDAGKRGGRPVVSEKQNESKTKANPKAPSASASASASESVEVKDGGVGEGVEPWTRQQWDAAAKHLGVDDKTRDQLWAHLESQGWQWGNGLRCQGDPRSAFTRWLSKPERLQSSTGSPAKAAGIREPWQIDKDLEAVKAEMSKTLRQGIYGYTDPVAGAKAKADKGDATAARDLAEYNRLRERRKVLEAERRAAL